MTDHHFDTPRPVHLFVEIGKGSVTVDATDTTETHVQVNGRDADQVHVSQDGDQVSVVAPKQRGGIFGGDNRLDVAVTLPTDSDVTVRTGSADVTVTGSVAGGQVKSGSGNVRFESSSAALVVQTGSGDIHVESSAADLKVKSGSGDVVVLGLGSAASVSTGSGDVKLGNTRGAVVVKTGSGDLEVREATSDVAYMTGSGDLTVGTAYRGRISVKGASGDVTVGVPAGVPVFTDISTVSGQIRSNLPGVGEPKDGAEHVEVRAKTVSGDVVLAEV